MPLSRIVDKKYDKLGPDLSLLIDEAVVTQAWKKSDAYIRRHNSYSDVLELDVTTAVIPDHIKSWASAVGLGKFVAKKMRLVPAPKNAIWSFREDVDGDPPWGVGLNNGVVARQKLRPLAHIGIREQTLATAVMLCIADAIETIQGPTEAPAETREPRYSTHSYGSRLFCNWRTSPRRSPHAKFTWGNSKTYSDYFQDYKRFLARPESVCRKRASVFDDERLFVVKLDLASFYDKIDRLRLIDHLKALYSEYAEGVDDTYSEAGAAGFWAQAEKILDLRWNSADAQLADLFEVESTREDTDGPVDLVPEGIPQGLVAGGFFANAYMIKFDRVIASRLMKEIGGIRLLDYCRYVDDMRLVVSAPRNRSVSDLRNSIRETIEPWINETLGAYCSGLPDDRILRTNSDKSEVESWEDIASEGNMSRYMRSLQEQISIGPDSESLKQSTASLTNLLWLADVLESRTGEKTNSLELAHIATPRADVRDDTVKRFAASRLRRILRLRRSMSDSKRSSGSDPYSGFTFSDRLSVDYELEACARKLIACWARNPSLVSVLKCAMDMYPTPELLSPVLDALRSKLHVSNFNSKQESRAAFFVAADLLRAAVVETGYEYEARGSMGVPHGADIPGYRRELERFAIELMESADAPWYVLQQAALYLATRRVNADCGSTPELTGHAVLNNCVRGHFPGVLTKSNLAYALIGRKICGDTDGLGRWLASVLSTCPSSERWAYLQLCASVDRTVIEHLAMVAASTHPAWAKQARRLVIKPGSPRQLEAFSTGFRETISVQQLVQQHSNPFAQENALLKLAIGLLGLAAAGELPLNIGLDGLLIDYDNGFSETRPRDVLIDLQDPAVKFKFAMDSSAPRATVQQSAVPGWCRAEFNWAYAVGRLLRSAIVGDPDFTSRFYATHDYGPRYIGIRSHWFKRKSGLQNPSEGLGAEPVPLSPWMSEFIFILLQWPGLHLEGPLVTELSDVETARELLEIVKDRLASQARLYGQLSRLPVYQFITDCADDFDPSRVRVAIMQTIRPKVCDLALTDDPDFRGLHKQHVASMCKLLTHHISVQGQQRSDDRRSLDLIVFPELSTHPDDMPLLEMLSDATGAAIFAGQTYVRNATNKLVNRGVWILRRRVHAGRQIVRFYQGKRYPTAREISSDVVGHRPFQLTVKFRSESGQTVNLTGCICYDATDLKLVADLLHVSDAFIIAALNQDVHTFDNMAAALHYHMFQPVIIANTGEYGGSTAQAPFKEPHKRVLAQLHGNAQAAISLFEVDMLAFQARDIDSVPDHVVELKTPPAGYSGRPSI